MHETIMPGFDQFPEEGNLIGRLLAGYGDLELDLCQCVAVVSDIDNAIKKLFGIRGEEKRIRRAHSLMRHTYEAAGLACKLDAGAGACEIGMHIATGTLCRPKVCTSSIWKKWPKLPGELGLLKDHRQPLNVDLLTKQEMFFRYVQNASGT